MSTHFVDVVDAEDRSHPLPVAVDRIHHHHPSAVAVVAGQTLLVALPDNHQTRWAVVQIPGLVAVVQSQEEQAVAQEAGQTLVQEVAGQTPEDHLVAGQMPAVAVARQTPEDHLEAGQTLEADQILLLAEGQTPAAQAVRQTPGDPVACQMPEAAAELQILEALRARQEERHKSHRTCRRASLVRHNEGSSWSPSRDVGPHQRPHRRQHIVLSTPRIKIEVISFIDDPTHRHSSSEILVGPHDDVRIEQASKQIDIARRHRGAPARCR